MTLEGIIRVVANRVLAISIPYLSPSTKINRTNHTLTEKNKNITNVELSSPNLQNSNANNCNMNHSVTPSADSNSRECETSEACNNETQVTESTYAVFSYLYNSLKWCPTSEQELARIEGDLLSALTRPYRTYFVDIGAGWGEMSNKIRTLEMLTDNEILSSDRREIKTSKETKQPLVLVHGFAAGIGTWILNLDTLSSSIGRKIYAFDIMGFGRSSRPAFDLSGDVEEQFVECIEKWREKKGIEKFILLGHSFGGYLSASYALKYPERISHVILADPWGVQDRQASPNRGTYRFPIWVRMVNSVFQHFNPLAVLRVTGPYGPRLVQKFRGDLREKFRPKLQDDCHKFLDYIYHCNAQRASGESAFKALTLPYGWPKNPLIHRLVELDESLTLTFIYGSRSWIEKTPGEFLRECLTPERVSVNIIQGSGHHVYADKFEEFNEMVKDACAKVKS